MKSSWLHCHYHFQSLYILLVSARVLEALTHKTKDITVADSGGVRGVQMHPPLAASNVFLRT